MKEHVYYVYILASKPNCTLYTGFTNNLARRVYEHKEKIIQGFTAKYNVTNLVYYETYLEVDDARYREACIKKWYRKWKLNLINDFNPDWKDLYDTLV